MPWAARAGVDPRRGSFFVHSNMGNLLLGGDDGRSPTGKSAKVLFMANCGMRVAMEYWSEL